MGPAGGWGLNSPSACPTSAPGNFRRRHLRFPKGFGIGQVVLVPVGAATYERGSCPSGRPQPGEILLEIGQVVLVPVGAATYEPGS